LSQAREDARGMRHRRRTCSEEGRSRVPTWGKNRLTMMGEEDGEDGLRRPQSTAEGRAAGVAEPLAPSPRWRAGDGEPKATHVPLWVAPGEPGGHPRARSPPGSKIGLQCSERGRPGYFENFRLPSPSSLYNFSTPGGNLEPGIWNPAPMAGAQFTYGGFQIWNPAPMAGSKFGTRVPNLEPGSYGGFHIWNPAPMAGAIFGIWP